MVDLRKIVIIFIIAVLFAVLAYTSIDAIYQPPKYEDYCNYSNEKPIPTYVDIDSCLLAGGEWRITTKDRSTNQTAGYCYDTNVYYKECNDAYNKASEPYNLITFIIGTIIAVIAILAALYIPTHEEGLNEWVATGFMLGGLITLFVYTVRYFPNANRAVRPIIIFVELVLILLISYRKLSDWRTKHPAMSKKRKA